MNGFSVEPGERSDRVMSIQPERLASKKSAEPTSPRISPVMASASTMATETRGPSFAPRFARHALQPLLHAACASVSSWRDVGGMVADRRLRDMRRRAPAAPAAWRQTSSSAARAASRSPSRPALTMRASTRSRAACAVCGMAVGAALFGQLRQRDQQGGFRDRQPLRLLAEIGERGGADAFEIAAIGRQRQVALEDLLLGEPPLDLDGAKDLAELLAEAAAFARLDQPGKLHRQRRAARDDAAVAGELPCGAQQRQRVDAVVIPEALVLIGDQHLDELRIDLVEAGRQPPAPVGRGEGPEQRAVAVDDLAGDRDRLRQRRREGAVEAFRTRPRRLPPARQRRRRRRRACGDFRGTAHLPLPAS